MIKDRLKNKISSVIGLIVILLALFLLYMNEIDAFGTISLILLGYILFMSKDDIVEAITLGIFKAKRKPRRNGKENISKETEEGCK